MILKIQASDLYFQKFILNLIKVPRRFGLNVNIIVKCGYKDIKESTRLLVKFKILKLKFKLNHNMENLS
jgi:hypothetical protein